MNSKFVNRKAVFAAFVAAVLGFSGAVHAQEWIVGGQLGFTGTELSGGGSLVGSVEDSGNEFGAFAQYRSEMLGVHAALGTNSTEIDYCIGQSSSNCVSGKAGAGLSTDLLGMLIFEGESFNGIAMFGLSWLDLDSSGALTGSATASGWKWAGGLEVPLENQWSFSVTYEYADLGEIDILGTTAKVEVKHSGIFARLGYHF